MALRIRLWLLRRWRTSAMAIATRGGFNIVKCVQFNEKYLVCHSCKCKEITVEIKDLSNGKRHWINDAFIIRNGQVNYELYNKNNTTNKKNVNRSFLYLWCTKLKKKIGNKWEQGWILFINEDGHLLARSW